jgi:hypothetical protein
MVHLHLLFLELLRRPASVDLLYMAPVATARLQLVTQILPKLPTQLTLLRIPICLATKKPRLHLLRLLPRGSLMCGQLFVLGPSTLASSFMQTGLCNSSHFLRDTTCSRPFLSVVLSVPVTYPLIQRQVSLSTHLQMHSWTEPSSICSSRSQS